MKILDILAKKSAVQYKYGTENKLNCAEKTAICTENTANWSYGSEMVISDPLLGQLDAFLKLNSAELDEYLTTEEQAIAYTLTQFAKGISNYAPSSLVFILSNHLLTKAESLKYSAQEFSVSLATLA